MSAAGAVFRPPLAGLVRTEVRLLRRHGVVVATLGLTAAWVAVLLVIPASGRAEAAAWILFLDLATIGLFVLPALALVERANGIPPALAVTRLTAERALAVRLGVVAGLASGAALPVLAAAGIVRPTVLVGVVATSLLASMLGLVSLGRASDLGTWMTRVPVVAVPLLAPAVAHGVGLLDSPLVWLTPFTAALDLLRDTGSWPRVAWLVAWIVGLGVLAGRSGARFAGAGSPPAERSPGREAGHAGWSGRAIEVLPRRGPLGQRTRAVRSMARVDRRNLLADGLVLALLAGLPVLALAVRWLAGPGTAWAWSTHGLDATPLVPLAATFVVVVHAPTMVGSVAGLLWCDDRDANVLQAVAITSAGTATLLWLRAVTAVVGASLAVAVGLPLAGFEHAGGLAGAAATAIAAGATAVVPMLLLAVVAADRVQAVALVKLVALPLYLPLATWFVDPPLDLLGLVVPTGWAVRAAWASSPAEAWSVAAGGIATSGVIAWWLAGRVLRRSGPTGT